MSEEVKVINQYERDDGTVVIEYDNGDVEEIHPNGDVKISNPNGLEVYDSADGKAYYVKLPNGSGFGANSDESLWMVDAEKGIELSASPDELKYKEPEGKFQITPSGTEHYKFSDGNEKWIHPDGRTVYYFAAEKEYVTCTGPQWTHSWKIVKELTKRDIKRKMGF